MLNRSWYLLLILLIEGAALMAVEFMGAKLLAPLLRMGQSVTEDLIFFDATSLASDDAIVIDDKLPFLERFTIGTGHAWRISYTNPIPSFY